MDSLRNRTCLPASRDDCWCVLADEHTNLAENHQRNGGWISKALPLCPRPKSARVSVCIKKATGAVRQPITAITDWSKQPRDATANRRAWQWCLSHDKSKATNRHNAGHFLCMLINHRPVLIFDTRRWKCVAAFLGLFKGLQFPTFAGNWQI